MSNNNVKFTNRTALSTALEIISEGEQAFVQKHPVLSNAEGMQAFHAALVEKLTAMVAQADKAANNARRSSRKPSKQQLINNKFRAALLDLMEVDKSYTSHELIALLTSDMIVEYSLNINPNTGLVSPQKVAASLKQPIAEEVVVKGSQPIKGKGNVTTYTRVK